jgi:DNA replication protein DnaC
LIKCVRCGDFFPQSKLPAGLFRAWLSGYCDPCKVLEECDWKEREAKQIADEKLRATAEREERRKRSRIEQLGGELAYETFLVSEYKPELNNTHDWFNHAKNFSVEAKNLWVYGPPGTGKTFLSTAIVRGMWEKGGSCRVYTAQQAVNRILFNEQGRTRNAFDQEEAIKEMAAIDALFIDELNELDVKVRYVNALKQLVDARSKRQKRGLIIAANVDLKTVATLMGLPLADRLRDKTYDAFRIPEDTPSARGLLKQQQRSQKAGT